MEGHLVRVHCLNTQMNVYINMAVERKDCDRQWSERLEGAVFTMERDVSGAAAEGQLAAEDQARTLQRPSRSHLSGIYR